MLRHLYFARSFFVSGNFPKGSLGEPIGSYDTKNIKINIHSLRARDCKARIRILNDFYLRVNLIWFLFPLFCRASFLHFVGCLVLAGGA